jgi:hypothetical protein
MYQIHGSERAPPTKLSDKVMVQDLPTIPKVGRKAVTPTRAAGIVMDPAVSVPIANGTFPAQRR